MHDARVPAQVGAQVRDRHELLALLHERERRHGDPPRPQERAGREAALAVRFRQAQVRARLVVGWVGAQALRERVVEHGQVDFRGEGIRRLVEGERFGVAGRRHEGDYVGDGRRSGDEEAGRGEEDGETGKSKDAAEGGVAGEWLVGG